MRPRLWLAAALPAAVALLAVALEGRLLRDEGIHPLLLVQGKDGLPDPELVRKVLDKVLGLNSEMAKWLIGLATSVLGGVMVALKVRPDNRPPTTFTRLMAAGAVAGAVLSIFFGHMWQAAMRGQVAAGYFDPRSPALLWPERLQYLCFLAALSWFGLLILEREMAAPPKAEGA